MSDWSVYLVRCGDGSLYTGIATDVDRRLEEHREGRRGSKYLRGRAPLTLFFRHAASNRSQASRIEHFIKGLSKAEKEDRDKLPQRILQLLSET